MVDLMVDKMVVLRVIVKVGHWVVTMVVLMDFLTVERMAELTEYLLVEKLVVMMAV